MLNMFAHLSTKCGFIGKEISLQDVKVNMCYIMI
jgi:hypothetical protein